jgi:WIF domain
MIPVLIYFIILVQISKIAANSFNLFLSQEEVKQLLGLENELFYVRDGKINEVPVTPFASN